MRLVRATVLGWPSPLESVLRMLQLRASGAIQVLSLAWVWQQVLDWGLQPELAQMQASQPVL
jgi:hypothetical protein